MNTSQSAGGKHCNANSVPKGDEGRNEEGKGGDRWRFGKGKGGNTLRLTDETNSEKKKQFSNMACPLPNTRQQG